MPLSKWQKSLANVADVFLLIGEIQRTWSYLEPLFIGSEEVKRELPEDAKRFEGIDHNVKHELKTSWEIKVGQYISHPLVKPHDYFITLRLECEQELQSNRSAEKTGARTGTAGDLQEIFVGLLGWPTQTISQILLHIRGRLAGYSIQWISTGEGFLKTLCGTCQCIHALICCLLSRFLNTRQRSTCPVKP